MGDRMRMGMEVGCGLVMGKGWGKGWGLGGMRMETDNGVGWDGDGG